MQYWHQFSIVFQHNSEGAVNQAHGVLCFTLDKRTHTSEEEMVSLTGCEFTESGSVSDASVQLSYKQIKTCTSERLNTVSTKLVIWLVKWI